MATEFETRAMTEAELERAVGWAADEGWNPGRADAVCFRAVDPEGFVGGFLDGEMIASISVVNYGAKFSFLGFYIVPPPWRGQGYGYALWRSAIARAGDRLIGLDGVVAEQDNYKRSGFELAYRNIRFSGVAHPDALADLAGPTVSFAPLTASPEFLALDAALFPTSRDIFWRGWLTAKGHVARAAVVDGRLAGAGVLRPCRSGHKIGPLYASERTVAAALIAELVSSAGAEGAEVSLDAPEPNEAAASIAGDLGMAPVFETARMYTGAAPDIDLGRLYGVASFELG